MSADAVRTAETEPSFLKPHEIGLRSGSNGLQEFLASRQEVPTSLIHQVVDLMLVRPQPVVEGLDGHIVSWTWAPSKPQTQPRS